MTVKDIVDRLSDSQLQYSEDFERIDAWHSWYEGFVQAFHEYKIYNGTNSVTLKMKTLHMGKKICEDWADLLYNERCIISTDKEEANERLDDALTQLAFVETVNQGIEMGMAHGTEGFVYSLRNNVLSLEMVEATKIYPITFENGHITECAFISSMIKDSQPYAYVSVHQKNEAGNYVIENALYKMNVNNSQYSLGESPDEYWVFDTKSKNKWFSIFKPNAVNNFNISSPYGISVFANAIEDLKTVDSIYDAIDNEITAGRMRIVVSTDALNYDASTGKEQPVFDPRDVVFQKIPKGMNEQSLIETIAPELRTEDQIKALNNALRHLSAKVGMGSDHYSYDSEKGGLKTATEVISDNAPLYRRIKKHEKVLENNLRELVLALADIQTNFFANPITFDELTIQFDDSIIQDKDAERKQDIADINMGVMSRVEYRMKWYGEDEDTARAKVEEAQSYDTTEGNEGDNL